MLSLIFFVILLWSGVLCTSSSSLGPRDIRKFYLKELVDLHDHDKDGVLSLGEFDNIIHAVVGRCQAEKQSIFGSGESVVHCHGDHLDANYTACLKSLCPDAAALYDVYRRPRTENVDVTNLGRMLPAVVYALGHGNCDSHNSSRHHPKPTTPEVWGYSLAFATLIAIVSNIGVFLVPVMRTTYYKLVLMFMVALAVGCMTGTSIFVLMPEAYDLMNIEETADDYLWKAGTIVLIIYIFFLTERVMNLLVNFNRRKKDKRLRQNLTVNVEASSSEKKPLDADLNGIANQHGHSHELETGENGKTRVATVAWMVLAGDSLHNFMDGLAIGAGFSDSVIIGLSISIAVICEEIPHELGDIAILVHSGLSAKRALFYNCLAAVVCYGGIIIGVLLGENTEANRWVYAAASGMFLYVSLVDMLPEVNRTGDSEEGQSLGPLKVCFIQNIGLLIGLGVIFVMANYSGSFFE